MTWKLFHLCMEHNINMFATRWTNSCSFMSAPARFLRHSTLMLWPWTGHSSLSLPLPSFTNPSSGFAEDEAVRQHIPGHRPALATPVMVLRPNQSLHRRRIYWFRTYPKGIGFIQPRFIPIPHLTVVWEHLQTVVFSASTAYRITLLQRDSTGRLYNAKWEEVCHWCHRRKTDPVSGDVPLVAETFVSKKSSIGHSYY